MVEGVLSHVGHAHVGVLPAHALVREQLAGEQLDHGGLASTIGAQDGDAAVEAALDGDPVEDLAGGVGVGEADLQQQPKPSVPDECSVGFMPDLLLRWEPELLCARTTPHMAGVTSHGCRYWSLPLKARPVLVEL